MSRGVEPASVSHGSLVRSRQAGGVRLTETRHPGGLGLPRHSHPHPAITLVLAGGFAETFGSTTHSCAASSLLFKPSGAEHTNRYGVGGARSFIIELLPPMVAGAEPFVGFELRSPQQSAATLTPLALRIYAGFCRNDAGVAPDCEELAYRLVATGSDRLGRPAGGTPPAWLVAVEEAIRADCSAAWSLSGLAHGAGVHPVYLARLFRRYYGVSVGGHVRRCRVAAALGPLADPRKQVTTVAHRLGYCDQSHFGRAFLRETGSPPGGYRRLAVAAGMEPARH